MLYEMYTLYHKKSKLHDGIFLFRSDDHAMYELEQRVKPEQREIYRVCNIGAFDVESGEVTSNQKPFFIDFPPVDSPKGAEIAEVPVVATDVSTSSPVAQIAEFENATKDLHGRKKPSHMRRIQR